MSSGVRFLEYYVEICVSDTTSELFVFDETETMSKYDIDDYWERKRFNELSKEYITVKGREYIYHLRGSIFYGVPDKDKHSHAIKWAAWYHKYRGKLPRWSLLD